MKNFLIDFFWKIKVKNAEMNWFYVDVFFEKTFFWFKKDLKTGYGSVVFEIRHKITNDKLFKWSFSMEKWNWISIWHKKRKEIIKSLEKHFYNYQIWNFIW